MTTQTEPAFDIEVYLEESATYIQERIAVTEQAQLQIGRKLLEVRDKVDDGTWGLWLKGHFDWSHSHANKLMQAAEKAPELLSAYDAGLIHRQALFMLAANCTPQEAREMALAYVSEGRVVNKQLSFLISRADPSVLPRFESGELTEREAYDLAIALRDVPGDCETARVYAVGMQVSSPWVVSYLANEYLKWISLVEDSDRIDTAWHDIRHNACLLIEDKRVTLKEANQRDVERYIEYRQFGHIEKAKSEKAVEPDYLLQGEEFYTDEEGTLTIPDLPPSVRVKVSVYEVED